MFPELSGRKVLVLGLGRTGLSVASVLARSGVRVRASDVAGAPAPEAELSRLRDAGVELETGAHERAESWAAEADLVIPSPGVPPQTSPLAVALAAGVPVLSEIELAFRAARAPVVAVTGTNGKTTVCRMIGAALSGSGLKAPVCGNIGHPFLAAVSEEPGADVFVVEASSFQLAYCETFRPRVAVITNIAPDHLDWHGTFDAYRGAKAQITACQAPDDCYVYPASHPDLADLAPPRGPRLLPFSTGPGTAGIWMRDGFAIARRQGEGEIELGSLEPLARRGIPFVEDGLAAALAALEAGAAPAAVREMLSTFSPDDHRLQPVATVGGVRFIDDSKATNPHAAAAAVATFDRVVLIAGGKNKGLDLGELRSQEPRLRGVVALGEAAPQVVETFAASLVPVKSAGMMDEAVEIAFGLAQSGDVVLLSPACASFDAYNSYAERGEAFQRACRALAARMRPDT